MRYRSTDYGIVLVEREPVHVASHELWIPREGSVWDMPPIHAWGVAGAAATTMMAAGSGASPVGIFGSRCQQWCKSDAGIVLGPDPFGTGTTLQPVTLSGQSAAPIEFYIEILTTGARGVATFKYTSTGSGGAAIETGVVTAATHTCIGAATGITINFPVGTYTAGDTYRGVVSEWTDQSGFGNHYAQPSSSSAAIYKLTSFGGKPMLHLSGSGSWMTCTSLALASGNDTPFTVFMAAQVLTTVNTRVLFGLGSTTDNDPLYDIQVDSSGPIWGFSKRDDGGTVKTCTGGTPDTNRHFFTLVNDGATQSFYVDGSIVSLSSSGDLNVGTATFNRMTLGARLQAAPTLHLAVGFAEVWGITGAATAIELSAAHSYFAAKYP